MYVKMSTLGSKKVFELYACRCFFVVVTSLGSRWLSMKKDDFLLN